MPKKKKHKHFYRVKATLKHNGKNYVTLKCEDDECPEYRHVERGWFQQSPAWWSRNKIILFS